MPQHVRNGNIKLRHQGANKPLSVLNTLVTDRTILRIHANLNANAVHIPAFRVLVSMRRTAMIGRFAQRDTCPNLGLIDEKMRTGRRFQRLPRKVGCIIRRRIAPVFRIMNYDPVHDRQIT